MHNIFDERFYATRTPAWHNIGVTFPEPLGIIEAVKAAKLDFNILKIPLFGMNEEYNSLMTFKYGLFHEETLRCLGIVGVDYELIQNMELAEMLVPLTEKWKVETAGALGHGETIFLSLKVGETQIAGEEIQQYFVITDTRDGNTSLKIMYTPVRVVCQNTLIAGAAQASVSQTIVHRTGLMNTVEAVVRLTVKMQKAMEQTHRAFEELAASSCTMADARSIFAAAYPTPSKPKKAEILEGLSTQEMEELGELYDEAWEAQESFQYYCNRAFNMREEVETLYNQINDTSPKIANTSWAAYNAVCEYADYRRGNGDDSIGLSSLFGMRASEKKRAFRMAQVLG